MTRRFQFSLRDLLKIQGFLAGGIASMIFLNSAQDPWPFMTAATCAGGCFGAAFGVPAKRPIRFGLLGAGAWLLFLAVITIINMLYS